MASNSALLWTGLLLSLCLSAHGWFRAKKTETLTATGEWTQECLDKVASGDCGFYSCFDQRFPCRHNFARKYGQNFCVKFKNNIQSFTTVGQRWINNTRTCAMRRIAQFYKNPEIECYDFHHRAEHIYSNCSKTNGVCSANMMWNNRVALKNVYLQNFSRESVKRLYMMFKECSKLQMARIMLWLLTKITGGGNSTEPDATGMLV